MIAEYNTFLSRMTPELPGCPEPLIEQHLISAAREFAERTDSLRQTLSMSTREGQLRYPLEADFASDILKLSWVKINGELLSDSCWEFRELDGEECNILVIAETAGCLLRSGIRLSTEAILAPKTDSTCAPSKWLDRWSRGIIGYAMQDLMGMEDVPWSNPKRAVIHAGRYKSAMVRARIWARTLKGHEQARGITV